MLKPTLFRPVILRNTKSISLFCVFVFFFFAFEAIADEAAIASKTDYEQAVAYENGDGVSKDPSKAFDLFFQCAKRGDPKAEYKLGIAYYNGAGISKDQVEGLAWMYNAVTGGISGAVCATMEANLGLELSLKAKDRAKELISGTEANKDTASENHAGSQTMSTPDFERLALQLRADAMKKLKSEITSVPTAPVIGFGKYPWHKDVNSGLFWIGMRNSNNTTHPKISAWVTNWVTSYGGYDNPDPRYRDSASYAPKEFVPRQNPFYVALPYTDVSGGITKPEAKKIIPWFRDSFDEVGKSVLKGRWIAIHHKGKTVFAQWEACGPYRSDHWQYVFCNERPRPTPNCEEGISVSPAVRDYLGMAKNDVCDWKFVDPASVPDGPWKNYGDNNTFVLMRRGDNLYEFDPNNARRPVRDRADDTAQ